MKTTRIQKLKADDWEYQDHDLQKPGDGLGMSLEPRGTWKEIEHPDGKKVVYLSCGSCGALLTLAGHRILESGKVLPSILCGGCGWHIMGLLEGWGKEESDE